MPELVTYPFFGGTAQLTVLPGVHEPSVDTLLLAAQIPQAGASRAIDLGCGAGFLTLALQKTGWRHVVATDVQPEAVELTRDNLRRNQIEHGVSYCVGDMLSSFQRATFDLIVCNPPSRPSTNPDGLPVWSRSGIDGTAFIRRLLYEARDHLAPGGQMVVSHSSLISLLATRATLQKYGYSGSTTIARMVVPFRHSYFRDYGHISATILGTDDGELTLRDGVPMETISILVITR